MLSQQLLVAQMSAADDPAGAGAVTAAVADWAAALGIGLLESQAAVLIAAAD